MAKHGDRKKRGGNPVDGADSSAGLTILPMLAGSLVLNCRWDDHSHDIRLKPRIGDSDG